MNSFVISLNAILPVFLLIALGFVLGKRGILPEAAAKGLNRLTFQVLLPLSLFKSIAGSDFRADVDPAFLALAGGLILLVYALDFFLVTRTVQGAPQRGALIHAIFRSNFIILGMPVAQALFGEERVATVAVVTAVAIPIFNVLAVFTLEYFRGGRPSLRNILRGIAKNPLIWACIAGAAVSLSGVTLPTLLYTPIKQLAGSATPIALLALGASLRPEAVRGSGKLLLAGVFGRLIAVPTLALGIAVLLGYRGVQLGILMSLFASPAAVASYTMAQQMGGDADLAGALVVCTSACSCVTMFLWCFGFMQAGLF